MSENAEEERGNIMTAGEDGLQTAGQPDVVREAIEAEGNGDDAKAEDALNAARNDLNQKIMTAKAELAEVAAAAAQRGESPPAIQGSDALDQNPNAMNARDLAMATHEVGQAQQSINGAQGQEMLRKMGDVAGMAVALGAMTSVAGMLTGLGIKGGDNLSNAALFTPDVNHGIGAMGQQQQQGALLEL